MSAEQYDLHNKLRELAGRIGYARGYANALRKRADKARTLEERQQLKDQARKQDERADHAKAEHDALKAQHFGTEHPGYHREPLQRRKAASAAWIETNRIKRGL